MWAGLLVATALASGCGLLLELDPPETDKPNPTADGGIDAGPGLDAHRADVAVMDGARDGRPPVDGARDATIPRDARGPDGTIVRDASRDAGACSDALCRCAAGDRCTLARPHHYKRLGLVLRKVPTCYITPYDVTPNCWDERADYLPMTFHVTIVAVAAGATFPGWAAYP